MELIEVIEEMAAKGLKLSFESYYNNILITMLKYDKTGKAAGKISKLVKPMKIRLNGNSVRDLNIQNGIIINKIYEIKKQLIK